MLGGRLGAAWERDHAASNVAQTVLNDGFQAIFLTNRSFPTAHQLLRALIQEFQVSRSARSLLLALLPSFA